MFIFAYVFLPTVSSSQVNSGLNETVKCIGLELFHKECDRVNLED